MLENTIFLIVLFLIKTSNKKIALFSDYFWCFITVARGAKAAPSTPLFAPMHNR